MDKMRGRKTQKEGWELRCWKCLHDERCSCCNVSWMPVLLHWEATLCVDVPHVTPSEFINTVSILNVGHLRPPTSVPEHSEAWQLEVDFAGRWHRAWLGCSLDSCPNRHSEAQVQNRKSAKHYAHFPIGLSDKILRIWTFVAPEVQLCPCTYEMQANTLLDFAVLFDRLLTNINLEIVNSID